MQSRPKDYIMSLPNDLMVDILIKALTHFQFKKYYGLKQALKFLIRLRRVNKRFYSLLDNQGIAKILGIGHVDCTVKRPRSDFLTLVPLPVFVFKQCSMREPSADVLLRYNKPEETLEQWAERKNHKDCLAIIQFCSNKSLHEAL